VLSRAEASECERTSHAWLCEPAPCRPNSITTNCN